MTSVIVKVLLMLVIIAYAALFITWNPATVPVCGAVWPPPDGVRWIQPLPLGYLPLLGAVAGAVFMAIAAWGEWARQKGAADQAGAQLQKAKAKLQELADRIKQQRSQISELEKKLAAAAPAIQQEPPGEEVVQSAEEESI